MSVDVYADSVQVKNVSELDSYTNGDFYIISVINGAMKKMSKEQLEQVLVGDGIGGAFNVEEIEVSSGVVNIDIKNVKNGTLLLAKLPIEEIVVDATSTKKFSILFQMDTSPLTLSAPEYTVYTNGLALEANTMYIADVITTDDTLIFRSTELS